jgi:hypothetical protein
MIRLLWPQPAMEPDRPTVLLQADLAIEVLITSEIAKLEVAHTAFRALEMPASSRHLSPHIRKGLD